MSRVAHQQLPAGSVVGTQLALRAVASRVLPSLRVGPVAVTPILAVDWGARRLGLAVSDPTGLLARPLPTLRVRSAADAGARVAEVARRESEEEAGCELLELVPICDFYVSPGTATERVQLYCGRVDAGNAGGIFGIEAEGEDIRVEVLTADQAIAELYGGRVNSTTAIIAVQWLATHRDSLRQSWLKE